MGGLLPTETDASVERSGEPSVLCIDDEETSEVFSALGSETAQAIFRLLNEEPATPATIAQRQDMSVQNVHYHLDNLAAAGLVEVVDTCYSEKGREMDVYAAADQPLVLFAGSSEDSTGIKNALGRLLGGYGLIGLAAVVAQRALSVAPPTAQVTTSGGGDAGGATADTAGGGGQETATDGADAAADGTVEYVVDPVAEYALSLLEPGVVFFLGAALVFTVAWAYWYRRG